MMVGTDTIDDAFVAFTAREKAIFVGRLHLLAMRHRHRAIRHCRGPGEISRGLETAWVVLRAVLGFLEHRLVTQKNIAAAMAGAISAPTISRAIHDAVDEGWVTSQVHPVDVRLRVIEVTDRSIESFTRAEVIEPSWRFHTSPLRDLHAALAVDRPREAATFARWLARLDGLEHRDKALILSRLHQKTFERLVFVILSHREPGDFTRAYEILWIILEAILTHLDDQVLTQKDLVAATAGLFSSATVSRSIRECIDKKWVETTRMERDHRVLRITPAERALAYFFHPDQVARAWREYMPIFRDYRRG